MSSLTQLTPPWTVPLPGTAAIAVQLDTQNYYRTSIVAQGLAVAETVTAEIKISDTVFVPAYDENGLLAVATATKPHIVLVGGPDYRLSKTVTVAPGHIYFAPCSNN
jgi:hypothetical protein